MTYLEALEPYIDRIDNLTKQNEHLRQKFAVLELRFEKMKCCGNCTGFLCCLSQNQILSNDICEKWELVDYDD